MSRGPGRIQQAVEAAFRQSPSATFTVEDLASLAYPGVNRIEKKHRVSVNRAAAAAAKSAGWWYSWAERPGHPVIYYNPLDLRSYAVGKMRLDFVNGRLSMQEIEAKLDDPKVHHSRWSWVQPGGAWWRHVEIYRAEAEGRTDEAATQRAEMNASVNAKLARLG